MNEEAGDILSSPAKKFAGFEATISQIEFEIDGIVMQIAEALAPQRGGHVRSQRHHAFIVRA